MPGIKKYGCITSNFLTTHLAKYGYFSIARTPFIWKHATLPVMVSQVVDDFGIKYTGNVSAKHPIKSLKKIYIVSIDWDGGLNLGL